MTNSSTEFERRLSQMGDLHKVAEKLIRALELVIPEAPFGHRIALGFLRKSANTLKAVNILGREGLYEECQILARVAFELRVTFECFVRMLQDDAPGACARVLDSMLLEKIKQLEAVDYYPEASDDIRPSRIRWAEAEQIIVERYSLEEFRAIKRNGFTGQSLENHWRTIRLQYNLPELFPKRALHRLRRAIWR